MFDPIAFFTSVGTFFGNLFGQLIAGLVSLISPYL